MGLFDFISGAGADKITETVEVSQDRINELRQQYITQSLAQLDIEGEQVRVSVDGEIATLTGTAPSKEAMEKMVLCAGNQHGIGRVDCRIEIASQPTATVDEEEGAASSTFYTVQSGDTLSKIAAEHYGDAGKYTVIFEANRPMLKDPDKIYPGQSLRIPPI